jgi:hypothetical protein
MSGVGRAETLITPAVTALTRATYNIDGGRQLAG